VVLRRSVPDVVAQAVRIAKVIGTPIQLIWSRADDMQHDRHRPTSLTILRAANESVALFARVAGSETRF
jgi:isoquinoline 1-oxidoreductase beta subunit